MGGAKDGRDSRNQHKKMKSVMPVWRPVSTQSGCFGKDLRTNPGHSHEAVDCTERSHDGSQHDLHHSAPSCAFDIDGGQKVGRTVSSLTSSSTTADYDNQSEGVKEKHAFSSCETETIIEFDRTHNQEGVIGEPVHDLGSNKDSELVSEDREVKKHSLSIEVDDALIRFVKGKGGSTQQQIEREEGVKLKFPSSKNDNQIVIEGVSAESLIEASKRISSLLEEVVKSPSLDYSHFISLPLAIHPELVEKLEKFQNSIFGCCTPGHDDNLDSDSSDDPLDDTNDVGKKSESTNVEVKLEVQNEKDHVRIRLDTTDGSSSTSKLPSASVLSGLGIDRSIFIKPKTFHLTVLMLKLWNKDRVASAAEVLQKISSKVKDALDNRPVFISLKGLECMRGSPAKARVVYAPIEEIGGEGRLLQACQVIIQSYVEAGLVLEKDAQQALKLHATLMNARHRKRTKRSRRIDSFDARGIFLRYGSEKWGDYLIREAHLSQRFTFDGSGYYHCCASIPFPKNMEVE